jgi:aldose 1-epimerase
VTASTDNLVHAKRTDFGTLLNGAAVPAVDLSNGSGMSVRIVALGATIQSLTVPDRRGRSADVVLGYSSPAEYLAQTQYIGATVGRYANRIARGTFELDGRSYALDANEGPHHLHGGFGGFDKALWSIASIASGREARVVLSHVDADGSGGYPGELRVTAAYTLSARNELTIEYRATTSKPTIVNLTHHGYFNLAGEDADDDVLAHRLTIGAELYTPVDAASIPTGERRRVADTAFDFRAARTIGERIRDGREPQLRIGRGYDHNFVIDGEPGVLRFAARLQDPNSGRALELLTTAPGLQFYSGNFLDGSVVGKTGRLYRQAAGLCLEPQLFPNSPNRPEFPSARLDPDDEYVTTMALRFHTIQ